MHGPSRLRRTMPALMLMLLFVPVLSAQAEDKVDYLKQVKPILEHRCFNCHGALKQEGDLRLDAAQLIRKGGSSGPALEPGDPELSLIIDAVSHNGFASPMPPEGEPLKPEEVALIQKWIEQGAPADDEPVPADPHKHWSFQPPVRPAVPTPALAGWGQNSIDAFLAAEHERRGLVPVGPVPPNLLLRRVYLDLIGLPPAPEDVARFTADPSPEAYAQVVERLLARPEHGERWGRHWMDVWRYSDWYGYKAELRNSARHIWHWREWIIESLNEDKPYDRMIVEMLAADELAPTDSQALRATGYLARNYYKFNRDVWLDTTVEHTSKAFLGLTLNCARCHDHLYDPLPQTAYYQFRAFFEPHDVRTERLAGTPDVLKAGIPRAYDARHETPTFLYVRGNDKQPDKEHPLEPAVPALFGIELPLIAPVELPAATWYPGLAPHVQEESLAAARAAVSAAQTGLATAEAELLKLGPPASELTSVSTSDGGAAEVPAVVEQDKARDAQEVLVAAARRTLEVHEAELESLEARIAADRAKFAVPPSDDAHRLALEAARVSRRAELLSATIALEQAEQELATATEGGKPAPIKAATAKRDAARTRLETAQKDAELDDDRYAPITEVYPQTSTGRRLALARWIADERNPLTARVAVNQVWMRHFGAPLVDSVFEFGNAGRAPTHPELLDWLAIEFMESGWSFKHLHRLIVTSHAYQMHSASTTDDSANLEVDPDNRYLWRMNAQRMEAELVRDSTLAVCGKLDPAMGGPELDPALGMTTHRRSLYYRHAPEKYMQFLETFDVADAFECYERKLTVVPQQALALANSRLTLELARHLAGELRAAAGDADESGEAFTGLAYQRILCRPPTPDERQACRDFLSGQARLLAETEALTPFATGAKVDVTPATDPAQRARENLVHVLLNHNDFVTIR